MKNILYLAVEVNSVQDLPTKLGIIGKEIVDDCKRAGKLSNCMTETYDYEFRQADCAALYSLWSSLVADAACPSQSTKTPRPQTTITNLRGIALAVLMNLKEVELTEFIAAYGEITKP